VKSEKSVRDSQSEFARRNSRENGAAAARLPREAHPECPAAEEAERAQVLLLQRQPPRPAAAAVVELAGGPDAPVAGPQPHHHRGVDPQCGHHADTNLVSPSPWKTFR